MPAVKEMPAVHIMGESGSFYWTCDECADAPSRHQPEVSEAYNMALRHAQWHGWGPGRVLIGDDSPAA